MQCKGLLTSALAVLVAVGLGSVPAGANLDNNEVGAAAVVPFITSDFPNNTSGTETLVTVTNAKSEGIVLEIRLIEGASYVDFLEGEVPGNWDVESYQCPLTGNETVLFAIDSIDPERASVTSASLSCNTFRAVGTEAGLIFFSVQGDGGNAIFADWAVVDFDGDFAFGAEAVSFQAGAVVNTDDVFVFDGTEYSQFPSALSTNFLFPDDGCALADPGCRAAALLLFTLDGAAGFPPFVQANIDFYDQYEQPFDADWPFFCFTVAQFYQISPNLTKDFNPLSDAGHMVLKASNAVRTPFHGWIIQSDFSSNNPDGFTAEGMWARTLAQSNSNFIPEEGGNVVFDDD